MHKFNRKEEPDRSKNQTTPQNIEPTNILTKVNKKLAGPFWNHQYCVKVENCNYPQLVNLNTTIQVRWTLTVMYQMG